MTNAGCVMQDIMMRLHKALSSRQGDAAIQVYLCHVLPDSLSPVCPVDGQDHSNNKAFSRHAILAFQSPALIA